jgi:hypothetical protein
LSSLSKDIERPILEDLHQDLLSAQAKFVQPKLVTSAPARSTYTRTLSHNFLKVKKLLNRFHFALTGVALILCANWKRREQS